MKVLFYIKYFFFIAFNWNIRLAWFTIVHEIKGEKKYGISTTGITELKNFNIDSDTLENAQPYQGANYYLIESLFEYLKLHGANNSIIDMGCGKGRVMAVAAHYGFKDIKGIDFSSELCEKAIENLIEARAKYPETTFTIINADASIYKIEKETNVVFMFNPFDEEVMEIVANNIRLSLKANPRKLYIAYVNPIHKEVFTYNGFKEVLHLRKMEYAEASILMNNS